MLLLKRSILERLRLSTGARGQICAELNVAYPTVQRWVEENNLALTYATSLKILRKAYRLTDEDMLEEVDITEIPVPYRKKRMTAKKKRNERNRRK